MNKPEGVPTGRERRLERALRENLKRRKAQIRGRAMRMAAEDKESAADAGAEEKNQA